MEKSEYMCKCDKDKTQYKLSVEYIQRLINSPCSMQIERNSFGKFSVETDLSHLKLHDINKLTIVDFVMSL